MSNRRYVTRFTCADCGAKVVVRGLKVCLAPPLCHVDAALRTGFQDDPVEAAAVRAAIACEPPPRLAA